jgi:CIC family chloride channel protein
MARTIGVVTGAAITSIVMVFEMTRNYNVIIPVIITVAIADGIRRVISSDSIYTKKLTRRGHLIPEIFHMNTLLTKRVQNVMENRVIGIQQSMTVEEVLETFSNSGVLSFVVLNGDLIVGVVSIKELFKSIDVTVKVGEIASKKYIIVRKNDVIFNVIARMKENKSPMALVSNGEKCEIISDVVGIITKEEIAEAAAEQAELFS